MGWYAQTMQLRVKNLAIILAKFLLLLAVFGMLSSPVQAERPEISIAPYEDERCFDDNFRESNPEICVVDLAEIRIPIFTSFQFIETFSPFSYVALAVNILFVLITVIWIFVVIRAAVNYLNSKGDSDKVQTSGAEIGNVFYSISLLFGGTIVIIIFGYFLGLGNFFEWPQKLSRCDDGSLYITKALELESGNDSGQPVSDAVIEIACFGRRVSNGGGGSGGGGGNNGGGGDSRPVNCEAACESSESTPYYTRCLELCNDQFVTE